MIRELWNKLDVKQRKLVAGAAIFVCIALILEVLVLPFWDAKKKLDKSFQTQRKKLVEITALAAEFDSLEARAAAVRRMTSARGTDFTLFAYLEKKAAQANVRGRIKFMNASRGAQSGSFEESLVDMKLDKITIRQLADFLYFAESPADLIRIKKLSVSKMKENPEYLSAQFLISSFQPSTQKKDR